MNDWHRYIGCEGIYLERGCVLKIRLKSVIIIEADGHVGADFLLQVIGSYSNNPIPAGSNNSLGAVDDFEVGSIFLEDRNEVITASGYVAWRLIFKADLIEKITFSIKTNASGMSPYRLAKDIYQKQELEEYLREKATV